MTTSSVDANRPSDTVTRSVYAPAAGKETCVAADREEENVTGEPWTWLHRYVSWPLGNPSSVAVAVRFADAGNVIVPSAPALTTGARFRGGGRGAGAEMVA